MRLALNPSAERLSLRSGAMLALFHAAELRGVDRARRNPLALRELEILLHHLAHQLVEGVGRLPAELAACSRRVATQLIHLGRTQVALIDLDVALPIHVEQLERGRDELAHR